MTRTHTGRLACDHCGAELHQDINGYFVGPDGSSDCPVNDGGHTHQGRIR